MKKLNTILITSLLTIVSSATYGLQPSEIPIVGILTEMTIDEAFQTDALKNCQKITLSDGPERIDGTTQETKEAIKKIILPTEELKWDAYTLTVINPKETSFGLPLEKFQVSFAWDYEKKQFIVIGVYSTIDEKRVNTNTAMDDIRNIIAKELKTKPKWEWKNNEGTLTVDQINISYTADKLTKKIAEGYNQSITSKKISNPTEGIFGEKLN